MSKRFDQTEIEQRLKELMEERKRRDEEVNNRMNEKGNEKTMSYSPFETQNSTPSKEQIRFRKFVIGGVFTGVILVIAVIIFFQSFTVVKPGYAGVKYSTFNGLNKTPVTQGFNWHAPWTNVHQYPTSTEIEKRLIVRDNDGVIKTDNSITVNTGDGKSVKVAYTYNFSMEQDKLPHIFTKYRRKPAPQIADENIDQQIINTFQNIGTAHSVLEIYSQKRAAINTDVFNQVREDMAVDGIKIEELTIVDVVPDEKTLAVLQQIADEQNKRELVVRQRNTLAEENINIEQQNKNNLNKAQGDKAVAEVAAQQKASTLAIEAAGQAKANREVAGSITPALIQMKQLEILPQVKLPAVYSGGNGSGSILNIPADILK